MRADMRDDRGLDGTSGAGRRLRITPQLLLGLMIVGVGLVLLLDNLGMAEADRVLRYWPVGVVLFGGMKILQGTGSGRVFGSLLVIVGLGLTAENVLRLPIDFDDWWPLVLIGFGVLILTRAMSGHSAAASGTTTTTGEAYLSEFATWAGKQRRVSSSTFKGADLTAIMGGVELDLRGAGTASGEAVIDVFVMWGGVEIWVPPDWAVSNEVNLLMGGAEDHSTGAQGAKHRLIVRGFVVMGGLEIKT